MVNKSCFIRCKSNYFLNITYKTKLFAYKPPDPCTRMCKLNKKKHENGFITYRNNIEIM